MAILVAGWAAIGLGAAVFDGAYTPWAIVLVTAGVAALILGLTVLPRHRTVVAAAGFWLALVVCGYVAVRYPAGIYETGGLLRASRILTVIAVMAAAAGLVLSRFKRIDRAWFAMLVLFTSCSAVLMIGSSPRPLIDVWYMYQAASHALLHDQNFYSLHWTSGIPGEVSNRFVYLPGSVVVLAPFNWVFGDVRYGLVVAAVGAAVCTFKLAGPRNRWVLGALVLMFPKLSFGVEQAWNDPLLVAGVAATLLAAQRGRRGWAVAALTTTLACKQYAWLFLPVAATYKGLGWKRALACAGGAVTVSLPWLATAPKAFWEGAVSYNLHLRPRPDSLSVYSLMLRHASSPGYLLIALCTLGGLAVALLFLPRSAFGFAAGCAVIIAGFDLGNKQTFFNEWELVAGLILLAAASADRCPEAVRSGRPIGPTAQSDLSLSADTRPDPDDADGLGSGP